MWDSQRIARLILVACACWLPPFATWANDSPPDVITFEKHVRPILKAHCFHCHGEDEEVAGDLDLRVGTSILNGGESGPAVIANHPADSLLWEHLDSGEMPPADAALRPTAGDRNLIRRWIEQGAPIESAPPIEIAPGMLVTSAERGFWSFQALTRPRMPAAETSTRALTPIDRFIESRLQESQLSLSPDASRQTLIRRLYLDLLGVPPSPPDVDRFVEDQRPDAYDRLVDRVLASPQYGERWGRHWLDVAGYADSEGVSDADPIRQHAWRYRDYVISSHNADKPFDRFLHEQLAGDELIGRPPANLTEQEIELLVATGYLRMAPDGTAGSTEDRNASINENVAQTIEIVSTSILGLTVGCARCHHHRYDPISHDDYYRFRSLFDPALNWQQWKSPSQRQVSLYTDRDREQASEIEAQAKAIETERSQRQTELIDQTVATELAKLPEDIRESVRIARETPQGERSEEQTQLLKQHPSVNVSAGSLYLYDAKAAEELKQLAERAAQVRQSKPTERFVRALTEPANIDPPASHVFARGDHEQLSRLVEPGPLSILELSTTTSIAIPDNDPNLLTTGRRLAYARWLTDARHPLPTRVLANRLWLNHFGRGLVSTPGDFGYLGEPPTHPALLDWLAVELQQADWSLKHLHRLIVQSAVYRQSSHVSSLEEENAGLIRARQVDPMNRLLWRYPVRRLDAETLRDAMLAVSGEINRQAGGPPVPVMHDRTGQVIVGIENLNAGRPGPVIAMQGQDLRRSVYIQVRRSRRLSMLESFDAAGLDPNCTVRSSSTTSIQSLTLMNGQFTLARARALAGRLLNEADQESAALVRRAWQLVYSRAPTQTELEQGEAILKRASALEGSTLHNAVELFCHALFSSNEFLYIE